MLGLKEELARETRKDKQRILCCRGAAIPLVVVYGCYGKKRLPLGLGNILEALNEQGQYVPMDQNNMARYKVRLFLDRDRGTRFADIGTVIRVAAVLLRQAQRCHGHGHSCNMVGILSFHTAIDNLVVRAGLSILLMIFSD